jgi:hypothetical protein
MLHHFSVPWDEKCSGYQENATIGRRNCCVGPGFVEYAQNSGRQDIVLILPRCALDALQLYDVCQDIGFCGVEIRNRLIAIASSTSAGHGLLLASLFVNLLQHHSQIHLVTDSLGRPTIYPHGSLSHGAAVPRVELLNAYQLFS